MIILIPKIPKIEKPKKASEYRLINVLLIFQQVLGDSCKKTKSFWKTIL